MGDEHMLRLELQDAKAAYRDAREVHKVAKADHDYLQKHVSDCRTRLLSDFDEWYVSQFGALPLRPPPSVMDLLRRTMMFWTTGRSGIWSRLRGLRRRIPMLLRSTARG